MADGGLIVAPPSGVNPDASGAGRTAWLLTFTPASDEPRLLRQARTLVDNGWRVVVCGFDGRAPRPEEWSFLPLTNHEAYGPVVYAYLSATLVGRRLARMDKAALAEVAARLCFHGLPNWRTHHIRILRAAADAEPALRPSLVIAHDYPTCPTADVLARRYGARVIVDSHEYMLGTGEQDPNWRGFERPFVKAMQDHYFARADQVIAVSSGIVDRLNVEQKLKRPVRLVRNLPPYQEQPFRPTSEQPVLLYHGIIDPVRDLDLAIEAAGLWTSGAKLILRGPGDTAYIARLRERAAQLGATDRVAIEGPVLFSEMIRRANEADLGYFVYADGSPQRRFVLPNKFFEYVMAGLACFVSDLPEMSSLVARYNLGVIAPTSPQDIATAVDRLNPRQIDEYKRASLRAAKELCWESEQQVLLDIIEELCRR